MEIIWLKVRKTVMSWGTGLYGFGFWTLFSGFSVRLSRSLRGTLRVIRVQCWAWGWPERQQEPMQPCSTALFSELDKKANLLKCEYCGKYAPAEQFRGSKRFCSMTCAKRYSRLPSRPPPSDTPSPGSARDPELTSPSPSFSSPNWPLKS